MAKGLRGIVSSPETFYKPSAEQLAVHKEIAAAMGSIAALEAGKVDTGAVIPVPGQRPRTESLREDVDEVAAEVDGAEVSQEAPAETVDHLSDEANSETVVMEPVGEAGSEPTSPAKP